MQPIAGWLVARPHNAVLGLAGTLMLPLAPILSGAVMALLVLRQGPLKASVQAAIAVAVLTVIALIVNSSAMDLLANAIGTWVPVLLFAVLLRRWRSVTLTLQISVIVAALAITAVFVVLGDPTVFWKQVLTEIAPILAQMGLQDQADVLLTRADEIAPQMTILVVFTSWSIYVSVLLLGYALMQSLPGQKYAFGRFCDLNFGRVLATMMAVASVVAWLSNVAWLQNIAFLLFAVFWIQGLALVHWLHAEGRLPIVAVAMVYVMVPLLNVLFVVALAIGGYADAWFDYRKRIAMAN